MLNIQNLIYAKYPECGAEDNSEGLIKKAVKKGLHLIELERPQRAQQVKIQKKEELTRN